MYYLIKKIKTLILLTIKGLLSKLKTPLMLGIKL